MMHSTVARLVWASVALAACAAVPSALAADGVSDPAAASLRSKGWSEGYDRATRRLVAVATVSVPVAPSSGAAYVTARLASFNAAMAQARQRAIEFLSAEIRTETGFKNSVVEVVGDPSLARALTGAAANEAFRNSQEFSEAIAVAARASLAGLYAADTIETVDVAGTARITVVTTVSPQSARAAAGERAGEAGPSRGLDAWFGDIGDDALARTLGIRFARDKDGVLRPVSFGQAAVRPGAAGLDAAVEMAKASATKQLGELRGELVASKTLSESVSRSEESSNLPLTFRSASAYETAVASESRSSLGLEVVGRRTVTDPTSGASTAVVAVTVAGAGLAGGSAQPPPGAGCPPVPERMAKALRQIRATGTGPTRSAALETALLEAVRREGTMVKGSSLLQRQFSEAMESVGSEVREKVASRIDQTSEVQTFANGFIHSYEVIRDGRGDDGLWEAEICANLIRFDPKDPRFGLPPTVAVLPFSCSPGAVRVAGAAVPATEATVPCEQAFDQALAATASFLVLADRDMKDLGVVRADIAGRVASGRSEEVEALKLGRELTADFVLLGKVARAEFTGSAGQRPQDVQAGHIASATVSARLVNVSSGEVAWAKDATVTLKGRDILLVRAGRELKDPAESSLSPMQLAVTRACRELTDALAQAFPRKGGGAVAPAAQAPAPPGPVRLVRVSGSSVTLDAAHSSVAVGARFVVNLLVDVALPGGRTEIDRDRIAVIEVTSVSGALAKARVVEGDPSLIDPAKCEAVPASK